MRTAIPVFSVFSLSCLLTGIVADDRHLSLPKSDQYFHLFSEDAPGPGSPGFLDTSDTVFLYASETSHRVAPLSFTAVDRSAETAGQAEARHHAGVLGRTWLDGQYIRMSPPSDFEDAMNPINGFRTTANIALQWSEEKQKILGQDVFVSFRHVVADGTLMGPGSDFEISGSDLSIGTTLFTEVIPFVRPFLQAGYQMNQTRLEMNLGPGVRFSDTDDDSALLLVAGSEIDLTADLAIRFGAELDFDPFEETMVTAELIYWFSDYLFFRGGAIGTVEAEMMGIVIGGGVAL